MKKFLFLTVAGILLFPNVSFSGPKECRYHPIQQVVRMARSEKDIEKEIAKKTNFNIKFPCGGSILQLAILRGNPQVLQALLEKGNLDPNEVVDNSEFPIKGAPKELPISFFAAYYAPRADILNLFVNYAGNEIYKKDINGQNILWYLEQNPILNNTETSDKIISNLVLIDSEKQNEKERLAAKEAAKKDALRQQRQQQATQQATQQQTSKSQPQSQERKSEPVQQATPQAKKTPRNLIEQEPESEFNPQENSYDLQGSDF